MAWHVFPSNGLPLFGLCPGDGEVPARRSSSGVFGDAGADAMDYSDHIIADPRQALERAEREHCSLEQLLTRADSDWSGFVPYQELNAVDIDTLSAAGRACHVFDAQYLAKEILDTYDVLVALGGDRLDSANAPAGDPAGAPEAASSLSPDQPPPLDVVESPRPRGSKRPPVRHKGKEKLRL